MPPLVLGLVLVAGAPKLKDPPPKGPPVVGRWECTALTINGRADPQWRGLEYEFTSDGGRVIYRDGTDIDGIGRTYEANAQAVPAAIDVCERADGTSQLALFKVDDDNLFLAIRTGNGDRPADFEPAAEVMTFTFSRVKPGR